MFGLLVTIIIGFIVKLIMPGKENMGFIVTTLLGIAGSFLVTYAGQALGWYGLVQSSARLSCCGFTIGSSPVPQRRERSRSASLKYDFGALAKTKVGWIVGAVCSLPLPYCRLSRVYKVGGPADTLISRR
jgi:uncharacterized membrane protein YeaQ/YmgE (transglycosylase-associated protein family)